MIYASKYIGLSGSNPSGGIKIGSISVNATGNGTLENFTAGVNDNLSGYIIISDTYNALLQGRTTGGNTGNVPIYSVPTFWSTSGRTEQDFLNLVNRLPARTIGNQNIFINGSDALQWLNSNGYWTSYRFDSKIDSFSTIMESNFATLENNSCIKSELVRVDTLNLLSSASLLMVPGGYKSGYLYSQIPSNNNGTIEFTRSSDATRVNSSGLVENFKTNQLTNSIWVGATSGTPGNPPTNWLFLLNSGSLTTNGYDRDSQNILFSVSSARQVIYRSFSSVANLTYVLSVYVNSYSGSIPISQIFGEATGLSGTSKTYYDPSGNSLGSGLGNISKTGRYYMTYSNTVGGSFNIRFGLGVEGIITGQVELAKPQFEIGTIPSDYQSTGVNSLGIPRIDYSLGGCPVLLGEPQRTNNFLYSEQFNNGWSPTRGSVTSDSTIAPDGNQTADTLVGDGTGTSYVYRGISMTNGVSYTISIYVKPINVTLFIIYSFTQFGFASFTLTGNGALSGVGGIISSQTITNVGNGWYRCAATMTANATASNNVGFGIQTYNGNQFYLWGAQLEQGVYPTSYIPTTSGTVTRNTDTFQLSGLYTNGVVGATSGTWLIKMRNNIAYSTRDSAGGLVLGSGARGDYSNTIRCLPVSGQRLSFGTYTTVYNSFTSTNSDDFIIVIKWNGTKLNAWMNGVKTATDFDCTLTNFNYMNLECGIPFNISMTALWNTDLSDTDCQNLSSDLPIGSQLTSLYTQRVLSASGLVEGGSCVVDALSELNNKSLLASSTFVLDPSGYKSGVAYSQVPSNGNGDLTVTRATTATRVNSSGVIETVASGVPQLDYSLGGCPNYLFEPQRTNLFLYSEQLNNGWGNIGGSTISTDTNEVKAPDGTNTAEKITSGSSVLIYQGTFSAGTYSQSFYAKAGTGAKFGMYFGASISATFDVSNGSILAQSGLLSASIIPLSNGWYRCICVATIATPQYCGIYYAPVVVGEYIYAWGAQLEVGAYPTSYIPTTSAAVTRNVTNFSRTNIYTNGLIGASGGTWLVELKNNISYTRDASNLGIYITDAGIANAIAINNSTNTLLLVRKYVATIPTTIYTTVAAQVKLAIKWYNDGSNKVDVFANGVKVVTGSSLFDITQLSSLRSDNADVTKYMSQMALWNTPLSDAQCISLSSYTPVEVAKQLLDKVIADAVADGGTFKQSNYNITIDRIAAAMYAFGTTDLGSKILSWVDPEYLPYKQSTLGGTASSPGCQKLYDLFRRVDFTQTTPASMPLLLLHSGENYWFNSSVGSNYCSTPDASGNKLINSFSIEIYCDYITTSINVFIGKAASVSSNVNFYFFRDTSGFLRLTLSTDGTTLLSSYISTSSTSAKFLRVSRNSSTGIIKFFTSNDGVNYSQLGTNVNGVTGNLFNSTSNLEIGGVFSGSNTFSGKMYNVKIYNDDSFTTLTQVFNPQSFNPSTSQTQWTSATGEVWTINTGTAPTGYKGALVYRNMIMSDAVDDAMASGNVTIGGQQVGVYGSARLLNNITSTNVFLELSANFNSNSKSFALLNGNAIASRKIQLGTQNGGNYNVNFNASGDVFTQRMQLISGEIDTSLAAASENKIFVNGASFTMSNSPATDMSFSFDTSYPLNLFGRAAANFANMSLHDLMIVTDITKRVEMENIIRSMSSNFAF